MSSINRRDLVKTLSIAAAAAPVVGLAQDRTAGQRVSIPDAFAASHQPQPLPFNAGELDGLSERLIQSHWENNYQGSVNALNTVKQRLADMLEDDQLPAYIYNDLKREHLMRTGSVVLHELYFGNMAPPGQRDAQLDQELARAFGSAERWEREFRRIGAGLGGGSGWAILAWNTHSQTLENYWMADHMHAPATALPLLVMDMYEHSYHMDFGTAAQQYIDAFMRNVNWTVVAERLGSATQTRA